MTIEFPITPNLKRYGVVSFTVTEQNGQKLFEVKMDDKRKLIWDVKEEQLRHEKMRKMSPSQYSLWLKGEYEIPDEFDFEADFMEVGESSGFQRGFLEA